MRVTNVQELTGKEKKLAKAINAVTEHEDSKPYCECDFVDGTLQTCEVCKPYWEKLEGLEALVATIS